MHAQNLVRAVIGFAVYVFAVPALLFLAAGTTNWPTAWAYVAMLLAATLCSRLMVLARNPDTLRERTRFTSSQATKSWDRVLVVIVGLVGPMATMIVAGLDHRRGWSARVPTFARHVAALALAAGYGLSVWAMVENRYFSAAARIQDDRVHAVVTTGPYRLVRHPSYAGALLASLAVPLMLDAVWALVPALSIVVALIIRTCLEDRMLRGELDGYQRYANQTRSRLMPGVW